MVANYVTLTRQSLYELVWSKPMSTLAKDFGISNVGLAKRCRAVDVPIPYRGYWARKAAGQDPPRTPLPKYRRISQEPVVRAGPEPAVRFGLKPHGAAPSPVPVVPPRPAELSALDGRLASLGVPIDAAPDWKPGPAALTTPPGWAEKSRSPAYLPPTSTHAKSSDLRARRILTQIISVASKLGWHFKARDTSDAPLPHYLSWEERTAKELERSAHFRVDGELLLIKVSERQNRRDHVLTDEEKEKKRRKEYVFGKRWDYSPSGELTLFIERGPNRWAHATFKDSARFPLEHRITDILRSLLEGALKEKQDHIDKAERARLEREETAERHRIEEIQTAFRKQIRKFERDAGAWERARRLRRYLRAARRALAPGVDLQVVLEGKPVDLLALVERFADQLDPLHPAKRDWRFAPHESGSTRSGESDMRELVLQVLGHDWSHASKLSEPEGAPKPPDG